MYKYGAAKVLLRPARTGTGVIAGSSVRTVLELTGIDNVYGKILGTQEPNANAYCTFEALKSLRKGRVLEKMQIMRERVHIKEEMDKEKQLKEEKKRKEMKRKKREGSKTKKEVKKNKVSKKK